MASSEAVVIDDVRAAHARMAPYIRCTPVLRDESLNARLGADVVFKCENLQRGGAFKLRGALNAVLSLTDAAAAKGVATHSSGNHGNALAIAAAIRGIPCRVVVPTTAPAVKRDAVVAAGAEIIACEPTLAAREAALERCLARTGAAFVPPYDDDRIIAGQGTAALELLDAAPGLDEILVPVGGGGLAAGTAVVAAAAGAGVVAGEPANADDAYRSLACGERLPAEDPDTIADGLRTSLGERNFEILVRHAVEIVRVSEGDIREAMRLAFLHLKLVLEPSAAVALAVLLASRRTGRIGVILSGGNVDPARYAALIQ